MDTIVTKKKNNLAVSYIRVSTGDQVERGHSLPAQQQIISDYCKKNDLYLIDMFVERGKSGTTTDKRDELQRMMESLQPGTTVIVISISRLSRNVKDTLNIKEEIKSKGCKLIVLDQPYDTNTAAGDAMFNFQAVSAQYESKIISERTTQVMANMSRNGKLITRPPYGYKVVKDGKVSTLVRNEEEQEVIDAVRGMILADPGIPNSQIAKRLNDNGIKIRKSKMIYPATIKNIISYNELR